MFNNFRVILPMFLGSDYCFETFDVNPECIGKIIGKAGSKIIALQLKHNVRIKLDNDKVKITGAEDNIKSAREEIEMLNQKKVRRLLESQEDSSLEPRTVYVA